jgi:hypothetical protein
MSHPPDGDAVTALAEFVATLRDARASRADNLGFNFVVSDRSVDGGQ